MKGKKKKKKKFSRAMNFYIVQRCPVMGTSINRQGQVHLQGRGVGRQVRRRSRQLPAAAVHPAPAAAAAPGAGRVRADPRADNQLDRQNHT